MGGRLCGRVRRVAWQSQGVDLAVQYVEARGRDFGVPP